MEQWKDIPGYEGLYQASNTGLIRSAPGKTTFTHHHGYRLWKSRIIKPKSSKKCKRDDFRVCLWKNGKEETKLVSRLVALAWVPGYEDGMTVNHKDGDYKNNRPENLEWVTRKQNIHHAFSSGLYSTCQRVILKNNDSELTFNSMADASRSLGHNHGYIFDCLKKRRNARSAINGETYEIVVVQKAE